MCACGMQACGMRAMRCRHLITAGALQSIGVAPQLHPPPRYVRAQRDELARQVAATTKKAAGVVDSMLQARGECGTSSFGSGSHAKRTTRLCASTQPGPAGRCLSERQPARRPALAIHATPGTTLDHPCSRSCPTWRSSRHTSLAARTAPRRCRWPRPWRRTLPVGGWAEQLRRALFWHVLSSWGRFLACGLYAVPGGVAAEQCAPGGVGFCSRQLLAPRAARRR